MNHKEERHQHHRKEREEKKEARKEREHQVERKLGSIHPGWYLALGIGLTFVATLIWTFFFYPRFFNPV